MSFIDFINKCLWYVINCITFNIWNKANYWLTWLTKSLSFDGVYSTFSAYPTGIKSVIKSALFIYFSFSDYLMYAQWTVKTNLCLKSAYLFWEMILTPSWDISSGSGLHTVFSSVQVVESCANCHLRRYWMVSMCWWAEAGSSEVCIFSVIISYQTDKACSVSKAPPNIAKKCKCPKMWRKDQVYPLNPLPVIKWENIV